MNDFHKQSIKACSAAVGRMQSHPLTREEKIAQIKRVHEQSLARKAAAAAAEAAKKDIANETN